MIDLNSGLAHAAASTSQNPLPEADVAATGVCWPGRRAEVKSLPFHMLIVEDNDDDVFLICEVLKDVPVPTSFDVVSDGIEALAFLRRQGRYRNAHPPSVVLVDINMPKMSGFDLLREMKADAALRCLPVVVLTTSQSEGDVVKSYDLGACSYITKPASFPVFREVVRVLAQYWTTISRTPGRVDTDLD